MKISVLLATAAALALLPMAASAAERPMVKVDCKETDQKLVYACMFHVMGKKSHDPIEGAEFTVKVDMPSMPMAHNVRPIDPAPAGQPGMYKGDLHLEMMGEWALKMEFKKPVRDIVVQKLTFGKSAMDHGKMKMKPKSE